MSKCDTRAEVEVRWHRIDVRPATGELRRELAQCAELVIAVAASAAVFAAVQLWRASLAPGRRAATPTTQAAQP